MTYIQSVLKEIDSVDLKKEDSIALIENIISTRLLKLPVCLNEMKVGEPVIRSRQLTGEEDFHHFIKDYSYNPNPEYIKLGRANYNGQPIFYGSRFRITSLAEVRFIYANRDRDEARYSIGRWDVKEQLQLAVITTPELIRKHNSTELFEIADF